MRNKCANCAKKLVEHIWILISWLINAVCGFVSAMVILIEKLLISLSNLLAILDVPICCKVTTNTTNKDPIEEGKKLLNRIYASDNYFVKLKELAAKGNKDAEELLKKLNLAGQTMINNLISNKKIRKKNN